MATFHHSEYLPVMMGRVPLSETMPNHRLSKQDNIKRYGYDHSNIYFLLGVGRGG